MVHRNLSFYYALTNNGTTAVAAAERPDRNENKIIIQTWRIFLAEESYMTFPFSILHGRTMPTSEAMLAEPQNHPAKVTAGL
jgi:hypothetical protein